MYRPTADEYNPYYGPYIAGVADDVLNELQQQAEQFPAFIQGIPIAKENYAYAPGKWTIKELIGHIIDTERIMAYRALRFARNDDQNLPGFDENEYVKHSHYSERSLESLAEEFTLVRKANLFLFESFNEEELVRRGLANNNEVSVRALVFIIAGHLNHHQQVLKERYL